MEEAVPPLLPPKKKRVYYRCFRGPKYVPLYTSVFVRKATDKLIEAENALSGSRRRMSNYCPTQHLITHVKRMMGQQPFADRIYSALENRLIKLHITADNLTVYDVIHHLADMGIASTFYASAPYFWCHLTGTPLPRLEERDYETLKNMYNEHRTAYFEVAEELKWKVCNGLPLQFVLFKLAQLLGWTEFATMCRLYTTIDHAQMAEEHWKHTCHYLGWEYLPTPAFQ